jgi:hypothetical protein
MYFNNPLLSFKKILFIILGWFLKKLKNYSSIYSVANYIVKFTKIIIIYINALFSKIYSKQIVFKNLFSKLKTSLITKKLYKLQTYFSEVKILAYLFLNTQYISLNILVYIKKIGKRFTNII